jgi:DNA invertase Pin-like site-specific DNA recombinase
MSASNLRFTGLPFAIYVRVSEVDEERESDESFGSPAEQEAAARAWAERHDIEIAEVVTELNVSGAKPVAERELGRLVEAVEAGEIGGIIVKFLDRYARDLIESAVLLKRIRDAGGRMVATASGFDTEHMTPETEMTYNILMSVADAQRKRNRLSRADGARRSAERGNYLASRPPLGYRWHDREKNGKGVGKIVPDPKTAPLVMEVFRKRCEGTSLRDLSAWLGEHDVKMTKSGVRAVLANRAYLGEATVPGAVKGDVRVVGSAHEPLVTPDVWERANAQGGTYAPRNGRWASQALLPGLPLCSGCGRRLSVAGGGKVRDGKVAYYQCTSEGCTARVGVRMERLDAYVASLVQDALLVREPHVSAIMEGDDRYRLALEAVEDARRELEFFIAEVRVTDVGKDAWVKGKEARQTALLLARRELKSIRPSTPVTRIGGASLEEAMPALDRAHVARFVDRIVVKPIGRGRRVPVGERVDVFFVGAEEPVTYPIEGAHGTVQAASGGDMTALEAAA